MSSKSQTSPYQADIDSLRVFKTAVAALSDEDEEGQKEEQPQNHNLSTQAG